MPGDDAVDEKRAATKTRAVGLGLVSSRLVRQRPTKLQLAALGLVTLLSFGPLFALVAVVRSDASPMSVLIEQPESSAADTTVGTTITGVSAATGEIRARVLVEPRGALLERGRLTEDLVLQVNDIRGQTTYDFAAGQTLRPVDVTLALFGGSIVRYPFDRYTSNLVMTLGVVRDGEVEQLPVAFPVVSNVDDFAIEAAPNNGSLAPSAVVAVDLSVSRKLTTTAYAVWMMILMWGLAISGVLIVWAVTIWQVDVPMWAFGYFVGVLFALPPLRELLPGRPPPGTLIDFVAFYWCIAIVGVSLIVCLFLWIQRMRPGPRLPSGH